MKPIKYLGLLLSLLLITGWAQAQKRFVTGKVISQVDNQPLQGVSILADKQKVGELPKRMVFFSISVDKNVSLLLFSYMGYKEQAITLTDKSTMDVVMVPVSSDGEEVVVSGNGTQKKSIVTGSVSRY